MTTNSAPKLTMPVSEARDHIIGRSDAPVTLVEYGDYECPYCRQVHHIIAELQETLGDRLCYVFRHFPIRTSHPHAQTAAKAAEAAGAQGRYWEMHDLLLDHQDRLAKIDLLGYAGEIGLDVTQFERELDEDTHAGRVREDFTQGVRSGVNGTPTFFINGARYDGAWDLESLLEAIEKPLGVQVRLLADEFMRLAAAGGIVLMIATMLALLWANLPGGGGGYDDFWHTNFAIALGETGRSYRWARSPVARLPPSCPGPGRTHRRPRQPARSTTPLPCSSPSSPVWNAEPDVHIAMRILGRTGLCCQGAKARHGRSRPPP